jgi:hypothetical protein
MFVRSLDVLLTAVFLPVAFVGLIELLRKLGFVAGGSAIGVTAFIAVGVATGMVASVNEHTTAAAAATDESTGA